MKKSFFLIAYMLLALSSNAQWVSQFSGFTLPFFDLSFQTVNKGYAVGQFLTIVETHDGGTNWNMQMDTSTSWFIGCSFIDSNTGYAVANGGQTYKTVNGGANWNYLPTGTTSPLYDVHFVNPDTGFICGLSKMLKTTNAGVTWTPYSVSYSLSRLFFTTASQGYSIGQGGVILKTTNGGGYWGPQTSGVTVNLNDIYFTDTATGWIVGDGGTILKTTNGGTTWNPLTSGVTTGLYGVWFITPGIGYVVGAAGKILKTTDGGTTWTPETSGVTVNLMKIAFPSPSVGYVVGYSGTILKTVCGVSPVASFTSAGTHTMTFTYTGTGSMDSVKWNFGDGATSNVTNPTHIYSASGTYTVCVVDFSVCGNDTACHTVTVSSLSTENVMQHASVRIYPNPTTGSCTVEGASGGTITIYNTIGQLVHKAHLYADDEVINIEQLPGNLYIVQVTNADGVVVTQRIWKE
jgi:photosystem II stability/assembly factor-like uncharacterized protein